MVQQLMSLSGSSSGMPQQEEVIPRTTRQRMYLFEGAYVDYTEGLHRLINRTWRVCVVVWKWFWNGLGALGIENILRLLIVVAAIGLSVLYVRYESTHGRGFSFGTFMTIVVIFVFTVIILWGWKAAVHFVARILSGTLASGLLLVLAALAALLATVVFVPYLLALFLLTAASFLVFVPVRIAHSIWLLNRHISYRCPWDDCAYSGLPIHVCSCGHRYDDLKPSFYGILHHTCRHPDGQRVKLPTMDFRGRSKLSRLCGRCKRPLVFSSLGELAERPIAILGGPSAGKTVFLRQAIRQLREYLERSTGSTVRLDSEFQEQVLADDLRLLDHGEVLAKTTGDIMHALGLAVRRSKHKGDLLYLFDAPGEHFVTMAQLGRKQAFQHLTGIILLVDPFSLPALSDYARYLDFELKPSETPFQRIADVLIMGVNMMLVEKPTDQCKIPLAVVLSKIDALPMDEFPFLAGLSQDGAADDGYHTRCRHVLDRLGAGRGLHALEQKFSHVQYFACSALGRMPDRRNTSPFQPVGVVDPLLWTLDLNDASTTPSE